MSLDFEPIHRLTKDVKAAAVTLGRDEARFLVDAYYIMQEQRIRTAAQSRQMSKSEEPHAVLDWLSAQSHILEKQVARALDAYSTTTEVGRWSRGVVGIGPVLAAGLMAHIDIEKAPAAGHIWNYAGLNPGQEWKKGEKRPWNAELKTLCWKIGESFIKVSGHDEGFYGHLYKSRKEQEIWRNEQGEFADQAAATLEKKRIGKTTEAYKHYSAGKLPPAHLHARARRYAVKLFLSHWHEVAYWAHHGEAPPRPYALAHLEHTHYHAPYGWEAPR